MSQPTLVTFLVQFNRIQIPECLNYNLLCIDLY